MNLLGVEPARYATMWRSYQELLAGLDGMSHPGDRSLLWRDMTSDEHFHEWPVPVGHFVTDPFYIGQSVMVRPPIRAVLDDFWSVTSQKEVLVFIAGLGTGKSYSAGLSLSYCLYLLSCMRRPASYLNRFPSVSLSNDAELVLMTASGAGADQATKIIYSNVFEEITSSPYFRSHFAPYDRKTSELIFPNRVRFSPGTSQVASALGWNVFGFVVDEAAFGKETQRADYVADIFNALNQRRRSRFGTLGFGGLFTSPGHDQAFVERVARQGADWDHSVQVVRMSTWDAKEEVREGAQVFVFDRHPSKMKVVARELTYLQAGMLQYANGEVVRYKVVDDAA